MLLKISLGLAILAGVAALFVSHVQVGGKITTLQETLTSTEASLQASVQEATTLKKDIKTVRTQFEDTTIQLNAATNQLAVAKAVASEQQERADKAMVELNTTTAERNTAQAELSQWRLFEMTPEQIRNNLAKLRTTERERDVFTAENKTLTKETLRLKRELLRYTGGTEPEVILPAGTKGSVVAVDPKYDFVILDIGGNQGVIENAKMLINRDGKLIGKVKITTVEANRAVANVLPEWKQDDVMEGDAVIF